MKCPNCGFETESAFCQMCGTKISEALHTQNNETTETEYTSAEQPIDKKKAFKIVKIVAACVIGAVIIAGITINVTAAVSGDSKSIFGNSSISDWINRPDMYGGDYSTYQ